MPLPDRHHQRIPHHRQEGRIGVQELPMLQIPPVRLGISLVMMTLFLVAQIVQNGRKPVTSGNSRRARRTLPEDNSRHWQSAALIEVLL